MEALSETKCHSLIDDALYKQIYSKIKSEIGLGLVKNWTENTDPKRYVYEDCGILAYLLCLKKSMNLQINYFADLGCGNGLLPYLLKMEGIDGIGIDARTRKIWDQLTASGTNLCKKSIDPTDSNCNTIPEQTDFLIGNHSDELTPWIMIMAARRNANFWILPCCYFDFFHKYNNRPTSHNKGGIGVSRYDQYLNYIKNIGTRLGYEVRVDKLKTSSAKRVCFIGTIPVGGLNPNREQIIEELLSASRAVVPKFIPIGDTVDTRNCTKIPVDLKHRFLKKFVEIMINRSDDNINGWRCGNKIHLSELSKELGEEERSHMKSQFGGLQTFFKNHKQLFCVEKAHVSLRRWPEEHLSYFKVVKNVKSIRCFFELLHPDGCPVEESLCPFIHENIRLD